MAPQSTSKTIVRQCQDLTREHIYIMEAETENRQWFVSAFQVFCSYKPAEKCDFYPKLSFTSPDLLPSQCGPSQGGWLSPVCCVS